MSQTSSTIAVTIAASLFVTPAAFAAETTGEFLVMGQVRVAREMVDFCKSAAPELSAQLEAAYSALHERSVTTLAPLVRHSLDRPLFSAPVPAALIKANEDITRAMLAAVNDDDARETCRYTLNSMKSLTSAEIQARGEEALQKYEQIHSRLPKDSK
jgi:hypothetical protein